MHGSACIVLKRGKIQIFTKKSNMGDIFKHFAAFKLYTSAGDLCKLGIPYIGVKLGSPTFLGW